MQFDLEHGAGTCCVTQRGLYWEIDASCVSPGPAAPRLFCDGHPLGPFVPNGAGWRLRKSVSNRAMPITPDSRFALAPPELLPYSADQPLPGIENLTDLVPVLCNGRLYLKAVASS